MQNPFATLDERLSNIEQYLLKLSENLQSIGSVTANAASLSNEADLLNVSQASSLLGIATQTLYTNTSKIPHFKRHGRLYFRRAELMDYLESGRVKGGGK